MKNFFRKHRLLILLCLITFLIHLGAVLFIYYADFQPFGGGGGDFTSYHKIAVEVSQRFRQGNFSLQGLKFPHYYPVIIGIIYTFTLPEMIIGQLFGVFLAVLGVLFTYLIVIELGHSKKWAFLIGLIVCFYPSYLFYGSLLLKDALVTPLTLLGLLLCLKLIKNFFWRNFLIFYITLAVLFHFRFYIGYALLFTFIFCWLLIGSLSLKKKIIYAIIIIPLLGFLPEIVENQGFYGIDCFRQYFSSQTLTFYQEEAYAPKSQAQPQVQPQPQPQAQPTLPQDSLPWPGSTWEREAVNPKENSFKFLGAYLKSFIYILLGPFPWQMKKPQHLFVLIETIPWYFLFFFVAKGVWRSFKAGNKLIFPLILFSFLVMGIMCIFFNNFGIITRIRIPALISLLCLIALGGHKI